MCTVHTTYFPPLYSVCTRCTVNKATNYPACEVPDFNDLLLSFEAVGIILCLKETQLSVIKQWQKELKSFLL